MNAEVEVVHKTSDSISKAPRIYAVEFIRIWFILSVIVLHAMNRYPEFKQGVLSVLHHPSTDMGLAVEGFFVIGGFFLYKRLESASAWELIRKTYLRLLPVLLFGFAVCLLCGTVRIHLLPRILAMTAGTSLTTTVLSPGDWFVGAYFWTSCLFIGIFKTMPKCRWLLFSILVFLAIEIKVHQPIAPGEATKGYFATYFYTIGIGMIKGVACMGVGMVASYVADQLATYRPRWKMRLLFTAAEALCLMCVYNAMLNTRHSHLSYVDLLLVLGLLLISISHSWGYISGVLNKAKAVQYASRYCLPALIGHIICIKLLNKFHNFGWSDYTCSIFVISGGGMFGMIEYHLVEKFLLSRMKRNANSAHS